MTVKPICKYLDPLCPCPDGDPCHYEGKNPMRPPFDIPDSLPWTVLTDGVHIVDPNGWTIAYCYGDDAKANAKLISAAVNAYGRAHDH